MDLLGSAAMLLSFDIEPEAADEHDDWHTREHLPERLSISGFLRGSRWKAVEGEPRYMVLYEVADRGVLDSAGYLERLDNPTPWTQKMMKSYRGMRRGFCRVVAGCGAGLGGSATLVRFTSAPQRKAALCAWLVEQVLPGLATLAGVASAHLLQAAGTPAITAEQQIRGRDLAMDCALLITGYAAPALNAAVAERLGGERMSRQGAGDVEQASYRLDYVLTAAESRAS
jgi:hypothetical protein